MPDNTGQAEDTSSGFFVPLAGDRTGDPGTGMYSPYQVNMADPADRRAFDNARHADETARYRASMAERAKAAYEAEQAKIAAERAKYARQAPDLSGAPAWWNVGGDGGQPQLPKPTGKFPWQQNRPQLPVAPQQPPSLGQRPSSAAPNLADVSDPRYALGIPNWRNYSSALRR